MPGMRLSVSAWGMMMCAVAGAQTESPRVLDLSTSKQLKLPVPGGPKRLNSLPMTLAVSPDRRYVVSVNAGYGTEESDYEQSLAVLDTQTGELRDFPDARTTQDAKQTMYSGLAFSADGRHVYASMASITAPEGDGKLRSGSGVVVYGFEAGALKPERMLHLPIVKLAAGRRTELRTGGSGEEAETARRSTDGTLGIPYPAAIAAYGNGAHAHLLVAENLSDTVAELDAEKGVLLRRFDLSENTAVPSVYPIDLVVTRDGKRAFVALWNASEVVELDLVRGVVARKIALMKPKEATAAGSHPCALALDEKNGMLYVALATRDAVGGVSVGTSAAPQLAVRGYFDTRLPGQSYFGAEPDAVALNADGSRVYAANMGTNSVAVLETKKLKSMGDAKGEVEPAGFVPTELMPSALTFASGKLYIATAKGKGTGPNSKPQVLTESVKKKKGFNRPFTYAPTLLYGSLAVMDESSIDAGMKRWTAEVVDDNRLKAAKEQIAFASGHNPIKHVIYIIRENRTYDQILGDLSAHGKPVGNGDPSLTMYGAAVTPNMHKLVLQFGVLDNFFDSAEVSGDGHVWSTAAIGTDYLEKTWQQDYRGNERSYDFEGVVAEGLPLLQHIPDVNEAPSGYLWGNVAAHGKTLLHFGEYISTTFCNDKKEMRKLQENPQMGAMTGGLAACAHPVVKPGEKLPDAWGGGVNRWAWDIPMVAHNQATKPELVGHYAEEAPDFNLRIPDEVRVEIFLRHLAQWKQDRAAGHDTMPNFVMMRLGNDHTGGTTPGGPTPKASVADNDLAVGRAVEAISHSAYWDDTAFFILEDDAQNGGDHVDAHRSLGVVISKYAPHAGTGDGAFVDSRFYSTVSVVRTMEALLELPPMNNNDAFASLISTLFTGPGDQAPFVADTTNRDNGLVYTANPKTAAGAKASAKMDFTHADRADARKLNVILWRDAMGGRPVPAMLLVKPQHKKDDDD